MKKTTAILIGIVAVCQVQCSKNSPTGPTVNQPAYTLSSFITGMSSSSGSSATLQQGSAPTPTPGAGPAVTPTANSNVINGGSNVARLQSSQPFQTVYAYVANVAGGSVGGYYELRLGAPTTDTTIAYSLGRSIPTTTFDTVFGVASAAGTVGAYSGLPTKVLPAATGDVQVSVSWNAASDVDLHVVDPRGAEIYWANSTSASGGALDLDSNAACAIDGKNNENIRWVSNAPAGTYTVRLDYFDSCGVSGTNYVVTVNNGGSSTLYSGSFTGRGDQGGSGSGRVITTFSRGGALTGGDTGTPPPVLFQVSPEKLLRSLTP